MDVEEIESPSSAARSTIPGLSNPRARETRNIHNHASTSKSTLPIELVQRILTFMIDLGQPNWTQFPARCKTLSTISLLSKTWSEFGQSKLHQHVLLKDDQQIEAWLPNELSSVHVKGLRKKVKTLRIGGGSIRVSLKIGLEQILRACDGERIEELWLATLRDVDLRPLHLLPNLKALHCTDLTLELPSRLNQTPVLSLSLQKLETLILKDVEISTTLNTIYFQGHTFPSLKTLYVDSSEVLTQIFDDRDLNYGNVFPELMFLSPAYDLLERHFYPDTLKFLNFESHFFQSNGIANLPPLPNSIEYLRFPSELQYLHEIEELFERNEFERLNKFWLPKWHEIWDLTLGSSEGQAERDYLMGVTNDTIDFEPETLDLEEFQDTTQPWAFLQKVEWIQARLRKQVQELP